MSKIGFPGGGGGGGGGSGSPVDSRAVTGVIIPDTSGAYSIGQNGTPFGSGFYQGVAVGGQDAFDTVAPFAVASGGVSGTRAGGFTGEFTPKEGTVYIADGNIYVPNDRGVYMGNTANTTFQLALYRDEFNRFIINGGNGSGIAQFDTGGRMGWGLGIGESGLGNMDGGNVGSLIYHNRRHNAFSLFQVQANPNQGANNLIRTVDTDNNVGMRILQSGTILPGSDDNGGEVGNASARWSSIHGVSVSGTNVGAGTQMYISGIAVGDFLGGGGGGNPVDSRAATGDILVDADSSYTLGNSPSSGWQDVFATSGHFASGIVITAPNGSGWLLDLDNAGILSTNGPFAL